MDMTTYEKAEMLAGQFGRVLIHTDDVEPGVVELTDDAVRVHTSETPAEPCQPLTD